MKGQTALLAATLALLSACRKPETTDTVVTTSTDLQREILVDFTVTVAQDIYNELATRTANLTTAVIALQATTTDAQLVTCKQAWRDARKSWETSESFLFGPVSYDNIDPRIDTWPVNFVDLDAELAASNAFTPAYIDGLQDALKGFHPIEYLLFGTGGNKTAAQFTVRELEYLAALAQNLEQLTAQLATSWHTSTTDNYAVEVTEAGSSNSVYPTRLAAYEEMVNAMVGICDEVANGKMNEPFLAQDPTMEESPFSFNSLTDFTNNIRGVKAVYLCNYNSDNSGLEDLVRTHNLSLDADLKLEMDNAIAALNNITVPFGQAIIDQPIQVQLAIDAINTLAETLETELLPLLQMHVQ
ncbi:MAG: imelysin family protein [Flavobacteriales bacterium]